MKLQIKATLPPEETEPRVTLLGACGDFSIALDGVDITKSVRKLTLNLGGGEWTTAVLEMEVGELDISVEGDVFLKPSDEPSRQNVTALNHKLSHLRIKEAWDNRS